jgi:hypothetical protein
VRLVDGLTQLVHESSFNRERSDGHHTIQELCETRAGRVSKDELLTSQILTRLAISTEKTCQKVFS